MQLEFDAVDARYAVARRGATAALTQLSLSVAAGEQVAVIGPSGAGKTTLLLCAAAAQRPVHGTVRIDGRNPWSLSRRELTRLRGRLFLSPQVPPLPPRQRVVTSLLAGRLPGQGLVASLRSLFYPSDIPAAHLALQRFDLADKLFDRVDRLSGGERQRVGLARALLSAATLWLIDEPLSALDPTRSQQAIHTLTAEARARGATLVATLHDVEIALAEFPRIVGVRAGAVVFDLPAAQVNAELLTQLYANERSAAEHTSQWSDEPADDSADSTAPQPSALVLARCR
jgi:phosphonate transport system ATP-binding protein